jgi:uncharacterized protein YlxW (UPF0749 family)
MPVSIDMLADRLDRQDEQIEKITDAIARLVLIEERQTTMKDSLKKYEESQEKLTEKVNALELKIAANKPYLQMIIGGLGVAGTAIITFLMTNILQLKP